MVKVLQKENINYQSIEKSNTTYYFGKGLYTECMNKAFCKPGVQSERLQRQRVLWAVYAYKQW